MQTGKCNQPAARFINDFVAEEPATLEFRVHQKQDELSSWGGKKYFPL
jgi:hypothetical protein